MSVPSSAEEKPPRKKAVFLTEESPFPPVGSWKMRDYHQLQLLGENFDVDVLCFESASELPSTALGELSPAIRITRIKRTSSSLWRKPARWFQPPFLNSYSSSYSSSMEAELRARAFPHRLLWISRLNMAPYLLLAKSLGYRVVLDEHNVESDLLMEAALSSFKNLPTLWLATQSGRYESSVCRQSHAVVTASDINASKLAKLAPQANLHVLPNTIDSTVFSPLIQEKGNTLFFPGTLNSGPNLDGLHWFAQEVLPLLRGALGSKLPRIVVAGANPPPKAVLFLNSLGIEVHANPTSILPFLAQAAVVFVPIRASGGTSIKVLEAMAAGRAVVSTGRGTEGLVLSPTYDIWIADAPDRFASAILNLLENAQLRAEVGMRAAETVRNRYDWRCARTLMRSLLAQTALTDP